MRIRTQSLLACVLIVFVSVASAEPIPFKHAIELALKRSGTMAIALAEQTRTRENYRALRDQRLPLVEFGSGLGYSWGIPLTILGSAPSIFNINTSSVLYSPSQQATTKAAKIDWKASDLDLLDRKNGVILDAATYYSELDNVNAKLKILREAQQNAQRAQLITSKRLDQGLDSELELKKAKLASARMELEIAEAEAQADVLRERLSKLIGVPAGSIETVTESIPVTPDIPQDDETAAKAAESNPAVRLAFERAKAADSRADAEHKALLPSIDFGSQYAMLAQYNNYDQFYKQYTRNNYTLGVNIRFPFINPSQRAIAHAADADAIKVRRTAEGVRNDVETETLRIQRSLRQLGAARDVARLDYEVAQGNIDVIHARVETGQGTARDEEQARLDANAKYAVFLDAGYQLAKTQMQMLRMTGQIQEWALGK